jgi:deazaflavin-dependent oxidoreductase (nitroreductase family)
VSRIEKALKRWGHAPWFAAVARRVAAPFDRVMNRLTRGRSLSFGRKGMPTLMLTTVGRKTGKQRQTPLLFVRDEDRFVVAGSNFGQTHHPAWALNLRATPRTRVQVGREKFDVLAHVTEGAEREHAWDLLEAAWPAYSTYRERSGRDILVFVLERA